MIDEAIDYINKNKARFLQELQQFLQIPSISAQTSHKDDVNRCALWLKQHLENIGLDARIIETAGHPIVWAKAKGQSSKRLIIYGHYDVQPEDPIDQWQSPPFTPDIRDGFIYARGATDDKGQLFAHIKGIEALLKTAGQLPCEVLFLIEGEEESGGTALEQYIKNEKANLSADAIVISDTAMYDENTPAVTYGLRGIVAIDVTLKTADRDLHSGVFGGAVANPAIALSHILSKCTGADGRIQIPGFYDDVRPLEDWEKQNIQKLSFDESKFISQAGVIKTFSEPGLSILERIWARPSFDINGIFSGYTGKGMKTIIPSTATAKISIRLVPNQNPQNVIELVTQHIKSVCPDFANIEIKVPFTAADPVLFDVNDPMIKAACQALKHAFNKEPVFIRCGGSIPVVNTFFHQLKKPVILMGFGLDSDGAHAPNEKFKIDNFINAAKSSAYLIANI